MNNRNIVWFTLLFEGIFNSRGFLTCFGDAKIVYHPLPPQSAAADLTTSTSPLSSTHSESEQRVVAEASKIGEDSKFLSRFDSDYSLTSKTIANSSLSNSSHDNNGAAVDRSIQHLFLSYIPYCYLSVFSFSQVSQIVCAFRSEKNIARKYKFWNRSDE